MLLRNSIVISVKNRLSVKWKTGIEYQASFVLCYVTFEIELSQILPWPLIAKTLLNEISKNIPKMKFQQIFPIFTFLKVVLTLFEKQRVGRKKSEDSSTVTLLRLSIFRFAYHRNRGKGLHLILLGLNDENLGI